MEQPRVMLNCVLNGERWGMYKIRSLTWDIYNNLDSIEVYMFKGYETSYFFRNLETKIYENQSKTLQCIIINSIKDILDNIPMKVKYDDNHIVKFDYHYQHILEDRVMGIIINKKTKEEKSISLSLEEYLRFPPINY